MYAVKNSIYSEQELDSFYSIFKAFDKEGSGSIKDDDLFKIFQTLNRDTSEMHQIKSNLKMKSDRTTFDSFIHIMQELERNFYSG